MPPFSLKSDRPEMFGANAGRTAVVAMVAKAGQGGRERGPGARRAAGVVAYSKTVQEYEGAVAKPCNRPR